MTRETAPYLLTPIQRPKECQPLYVLGPKISPSYSELRAEVERLQEQVDNENRHRQEAQHRLAKAAIVFAGLSFSHPELRPLLRRAREDIWPEVGE